MKANPRLRPLRAPLAPLLAAAATMLALAGCSERGIVPAPVPTPTSTPTRAPPPLPSPPANWRDAPITPGDWALSANASQSAASFAGGQLVLRCDLPQRTVTLLRAGTGTAMGTGQVPMTVTTETVTRPLTGTAQGGPAPAIAITFSARDPLLDAMAFSRGRFMVEAAGLPALYVPSWPEVSRVIEDCR
ncbi:hypothetical protein [Novosphingobium album (ex Liu et al. 2023)]|uniref:Lipoprotein n=1 Tax=Novosphingobium album (ex Liu et al. 2023) TaxID=3031130 RepID=A0ABT5WTY1_9SPHN|nr:hypothetical protein [Novosphingobium album (ex Liu et al. 2023)]MDE8653318.1 hypothetical protein [Novosphingobium album (ex Liu et al. 2023)]